MNQKSVVEAAIKFASVWDSAYLADEIATALGCWEMDALERLMIETDNREVAEMWVDMHARGDDPGDDHFQGVIVYSTPGCVQCSMTKRVLDGRGIPYLDVDLSIEPDALTAVQRMGYMRAPIVEVQRTGEHWGGFQPDRLNAIENVDPYEH